MVPRATAERKKLKGAMFHICFDIRERVKCQGLDTSNFDAFLMELAKSGENFGCHINLTDDIMK